MSESLLHDARATAPVKQLHRQMQVAVLPSALNAIG